LTREIVREIDLMPALRNGHAYIGRKLESCHAQRCEGGTVRVISRPYKGRRLRDKDRSELLTLGSRALSN